MPVATTAPPTVAATGAVTVATSTTPATPDMTAHEAMQAPWYALQAAIAGATAAPPVVTPAMPPAAALHGVRLEIFQRPWKSCSQRLTHTQATQAALQPVWQVP